ncbi:MAG: M1 family aminopeptidase, partial [Bacteroidota bacterium]
SYPINNYNVTFNIGKYKKSTDVYDNGISKLDLGYYLLEENDTDVSVTTAVVKPMLKTFEKYFGPYPFPEDGFKLVESPHPMEHQSCVAIGSDYFYDADDSGVWSDMPEGDINYSIVLHESAHEWWGNSVSCTDNAELWIHEAFATYAESLFVEDHYGYEAGQQYINSMEAEVLNRNPIVGRMGVNHIHYDITDMYLKGAIMLNELRKVIDNDDLWFSILKGIQKDYKYSSITTREVIEYFNHKSRRNFDEFFQKWLYEIP